MSCWCLRKAKGRGKSNKALVWDAGWSSGEGAVGDRGLALIPAFPPAPSCVEEHV